MKSTDNIRKRINWAFKEVDLQHSMSDLLEEYKQLRKIIIAALISASILSFLSGCCVMLMLLFLT